jgi:RecA-family ATPase
LLSGRGSIGKSLLAQQVGTALALGAEFLGPARAPLNVLMWCCEDDHDELWRRQEKICRDFKISVGQLTNLTIDARLGMRNELYAMEYGAGGWTSVYGELQAQIKECNADVLVLDNIGHCYAGGENVRHDVTTFCAGIAGIVPDRPFATILIGHLAKTPGSEYAGSTAWENAVRMRWYMGDKLPDQQQPEEEDPDPTVRFLCKRKANYTALDYLQLNYDQGVFRVQRPNGAGDGSPLMSALRAQRAQTIVLNSIERLATQGRHGTDGGGRYYLPKLIMDSGWHEGHTKLELRKAVDRLLGDGKIAIGEVRRDAKNRPVNGLKVVVP